MLIATLSDHPGRACEGCRRLAPARGARTRAQNTPRAAALAASPCGRSILMRGSGPRCSDGSQTPFLAALAGAGAAGAARADLATVATWLIPGGPRLGQKPRRGTECGCTVTPSRAMARRIAIVAPTASDVRDVLVEGPSGFLAIASNSTRAAWEPSKRRLEAGRRRGHLLSRRGARAAARAAADLAYLRRAGDAGRTRKRSTCSTSVCALASGRAS